MQALVCTACVPCVCPSGFFRNAKNSKLARSCKPRLNSHSSTYTAIRAGLLEDVGQLIVSGTRTLGIPVTVVGGIVLGYTKFFGDLEVLKSDVNYLREDSKKDFDNLKEILKKDFDNLKEDLEKAEKSRKEDLEKAEKSRKEDLEKVEKSRKEDLEKVEKSRREDLEKVENSRKSDVEKQDKKLDEKFDELKGLIAGNLAQRLANVEGKVEVQGRMISRDDSSKAF